MGYESSRERTFVCRVAHKRQPVRQSLDELSQPLEPPEPRPFPEAIGDGALLRDRLQSAIQRLAVPYGQVVMLMREELSRAEIAEVLGITET